ncbi:MAG: hypothetical protein WDM90_01420 [Ferruginibacter sp.]
MLLLFLLQKILPAASLKKKLKNWNNKKRWKKKRLRISQEMHDDIGAGLHKFR